MEYIFPGFTHPQIEGKVWWFPFHQTPDIPEALVDGKERMYLSWFYHNIYNLEEYLAGHPIYFWIV